MLASISSTLLYKSAKAVFGGIFIHYIGYIIVSCQNEAPAVGHFLIGTILGFSSFLFVLY